jgi:hypothetical protein
MIIYVFKKKIYETKDNFFPINVWWKYVGISARAKVAARGEIFHKLEPEPYKNITAQH